MLWILGNDFCQQWSISPSCFYKCSLDHNRQDYDRLTKYAIKVAGEDPARYGYVKIEGDGNVSTEDNSIAFCCDTMSDLEFVYNQVVNAVLNHPGVIDLRGDSNIRIM